MVGATIKVDVEGLETFQAAVTDLRDCLELLRCVKGRLPKAERKKVERFLYRTTLKWKRKKA